MALGGSIIHVLSTLTFLGAAGTVTGSKHLLDLGGRRVLVDCGLFQGLNSNASRWTKIRTGGALASKARLTLLLSLLSPFLLISARLAAQVPSARLPDPLVERVVDTDFIQIYARSFDQLDSNQRALAYWPTQESIAIDPIIYDQFSRFGVRQKRVLEEIAAHRGEMAPTLQRKLQGYALLSWANRGNRNATTGQTFVPTFTADELKQAAIVAQTRDTFRTVYADLPLLPMPQQLRGKLEALVRRSSIQRSSPCRGRRRRPPDWTFCRPARTRSTGTSRWLT